MHLHVVTLFPELFASVLETSMLKKGQERGALQFSLHNIRDYATDKHRVTDDTPYGGGQGMVLKPEPVIAAMEAIESGAQRPRRVLLCPHGALLTQARAQALAAEDAVVLVCGRYEGIDERVRELGLVDEEVSIGDFVLSGGEVAALVLVEALSRRVPGVVGKSESVERESFVRDRLDYPHYTRPREFRGLAVPEVLLSGNHAAIESWRRARALERTRSRRPDLLARRPPERGEEG